jgi:hypothetical protein
MAGYELDIEAGWKAARFYADEGSQDAWIPKMT